MGASSCHTWTVALGDHSGAGRLSGKYVNFTVSENHDQGDHVLRCLDVDGGWHPELAHRYVQLRTECQFPINPVVIDGIELLDTEGVRHRIAAATVPHSVGGNFDVVRSDMGEVFTYAVLESEYGTVFGYQSVRDRELIQLPGRGIDAVGIEVNGERLTLCLGEAKVSDAAASPPAVVDAADDSLRNQHRGHMADRDKTSQKLWDLARRARSQDLQNLFTTAALLFEQEAFDKLEVIVCCLLVRPSHRYTVADFGSFATTPGDYAPAKVRFLVVRLPDASIEVARDAFVVSVQAEQAA